MYNNQIFPLLLIFLLFPVPIFGTNQEPINIGFIFSLPWDVSNTLRAPVAGPLSIVLAGCLALICFAGLAFAPVWWIFGLPKRKYHFHTVPSNQDIFDGGRSLAFLENPQNFSEINGNVTYPDFLESLFLFFPHFEFEEDCKKLVTCHAHGFLSFLPQEWVRIYHFFSKKLLNIPKEYKDAIVGGLEDQGSCMKRYPNCNSDIVKMAKKTLYHNVPERIKQLFHLEMKP